MKNLLTTFCFLLVFGMVNGQNSKTVDHFHGIDISSGINATFVESSDCRVEYNSTKGSIDDVVIKVKDGILIVKPKSNSWWSSSKSNARVTIYGSDISSIDASSGSLFQTRGEINSESLSVDASSGASVVIEVDTRKFSAESSSGSQITVKGSTNQLVVDVSSGGAFTGHELRSRKARVEASSGGSAKVFCSESLTADASSGGMVQYKGNPSNTNIDAGYSGTVKKM